MNDHTETEISFSAAGAWLGLAAYVGLMLIVALAFL